jgi:hypothetical protein
MGWVVAAVIMLRENGMPNKMSIVKLQFSNFSSNITT